MIRKRWSRTYSPEILWTATMTDGNLTKVNLIHQLKSQSERDYLSSVAGFHITRISKIKLMSGLTVAHKTRRGLITSIR